MLQFHKYLKKRFRSVHILKSSKKYRKIYAGPRLSRFVIFLLFDIAL